MGCSQAKSVVVDSDQQTKKKEGILILGASGNVGKATALSLLQMKQNVTAGVRDPKCSKSKELIDAGVKVIEASMGSNQADLTRILNNYSAIFIVSPGHIDCTNLVINAINASKQAQVDYVLVVSVPSVTHRNTIYGKQFGQIEDYLINSKLNYGIIRLAFFTENIFESVGSIQSESNFYGPVEGSVVMATIAVDDIGLSAGHILSNPQKHQNQIYTLVSDTQSQDQQAKSFSQALGKNINYINATSPGFKQALIDHIPEWQIDGLIELFQLAQKGDPSQTKQTNDIKRITGQDPTTNFKWMQKYSTYFKQQS